MLLWQTLKSLCCSEHLRYSEILYLILTLNLNNLTMAKTKKISKETKSIKSIKKTDAKKFIKSYDLSAKKRVWPGFFQDVKYIHLKDLYSQKSFSLTINELKCLVRQMPRLERKLHKLELQHIASTKESETTTTSKDSGSEKSSSGSDTDSSS